MTLLSKPNAFNTGADLWIVPDSRSSSWTKKIDWYLNFQLMKVTPRSPAPLTTSLLSILKETEITVSLPPVSNNSPLLVESSHYFPNKWTVQLLYNQSLEEWASKIVTTWQGLSSPTLRIFLPAQAKPEEFSNVWARLSKSTNFSVVLDS